MCRPERSVSAFPLTNLISDAYQVGLDQITGPDWLNSEFYAINVKLPQGSTKEQDSQMMANLLAERFGLVIHRVTKEVSGYENTVASGGPKLTPSGPASRTTLKPSPDFWRPWRPRYSRRGGPVAPPALRCGRA
ncbi:MAG TPA: TIGR03435 family protein [Bryobacteraceae bacterium]|nr:TIGR03435 family protein [Bryobacteraceae bacterium]